MEPKLLNMFAAGFCSNGFLIECLRDRDPLTLIISATFVILNIVFVI